MAATLQSIGKQFCRRRAFQEHEPAALFGVPQRRRLRARPRRDREPRVEVCTPTRRDPRLTVAALHGIAYLVLGRGGAALAQNHDLPALVGVMAGIILSGSAMLSQAMESVTRTFYTRSDLELILSSPVRGAKGASMPRGSQSLNRPACP